jgi:hypothetical protein
MYRIIETETEKVLRSKEVNYYFNKQTGFMATWGKTKEADPDFSPYGPFILDIEITSKCNGPSGKLCPFCFPPGTKISTSTEDKSIENIRVGDIVLSFNENTKVLVENKVLEIYDRYVDEELLVIDLGDITIETTSEHPFYVKDRGWVLAKDLTDKDILLELNITY